MNNLGTFTNTYVGVTNRLQTVAYPGGTTANYLYFPNAQDKRLQEIKNQTSANVLISQFDYTYDTEGQILTWTKNYPGLNPAPQRFDLGYDNADQLLTAPLKNASTNALIKQYTYGYDLASNRTSERVGTTTTTSTPNNVNELISQSGGTNRTLTYDANGSLTNDGTSRTFEWDAANRLTAVNYTGTTKRTEFSYDGLSRMSKVVEKTGININSTRKFVWCGNERCEYRNASDAVTLRLYPQGQLSGTTPYYYTRDHLGSIRELLNNTGSVVGRYNYDPYGRSTTVVNNTVPDLNFTGLYRHSMSNLDFATYRAYDPGLGRWLSRDPIAEAGGVNLYAYVGNNSTNAIDPLGLRDIYIAIWNAQLPYGAFGYGSVGHLAALELNGTVLSSQFPNPHGPSGSNTTLSYARTVDVEGRFPDSAFKVFVPDNAAFDASITDGTSRPTWWFLGVGRNNTNCTRSVENALNAGGVPVAFDIWPSLFALNLEALALHPSTTEPWKVTRSSPSMIPIQR